MEVKTTYVFEKDGVTGYACGYKPEDVEVFEEREILYAANNFKLYRNNEEIGYSVWLKDGDVKENYEERENPITPIDI